MDIIDYSADTIELAKEFEKKTGLVAFNPASHEASGSFTEWLVLRITKNHSFKSKLSHPYRFLKAGTLKEMSSLLNKAADQGYVADGPLVGEKPSFIQRIKYIKFGNR